MKELIDTWDKLLDGVVETTVNEKLLLYVVGSLDYKWVITKYWMDMNPKKKLHIEEWIGVVARKDVIWIWWWNKKMLR